MLLASPLRRGITLPKKKVEEKKETFFLWKICDFSVAIFAGYFKRKDAAAFMSECMVS